MGKRSTNFLDIGDAQIAYRESGSGPVLILLHGNSESKAIFAACQTVHFKDFHTFALDSRGHGETRSQDERYSIGGYADDVIAFCKAKGIDKACVIGYSDGGNIALFLAKKDPGRFEKIAALSPNTKASGTVDWALKTFKFMSKVMGMLGDRKGVMRFDLMLNDIGLSDADLASIHANLRILYAEHDLIKESHILEIARLVPGAALKKIMRCNHMNILEQPATIADLREYFLAK
jgi:pimeloyl-ACP methyl ester carboxylesterase